MTNAREEIFKRIRQSTRRSSSIEDSEAIVSKRLGQHSRGCLPAYTEPALERFIARAEKASASVITIPHINEFGKALSGYLAEHGLQQRIAAAPSPMLDEVSWPDGYQVERRIAEATDQVAVSVAFSGIAETGTLALLSGSQTPTTLNFLADNYICLLQQNDIVAHMEDVWDRVRTHQGGMPRTLNFITGPSRTADVEQTIQLGAHGPRRLLIIIVMQEP